MQAQSPAALEALIAQVGDGPFDIACASDSPLIPILTSCGFEPYANTVVLARRIDGYRKQPAPRDVTIEPYRNEWAESFTAAEAEAMADFSFYREVGSPTGFESAEGWGTFLTARSDDRIVGFVQAEMPSGWINWIGVVPSERGRGIGRALVGMIAVAVRDAVGSHLVVEVDDTPDNIPFWQKQGFQRRTGQVSLIRR